MNSDAALHNVREPEHKKHKKGHEKHKTDAV
jgi:hypothetical protein